MNAASRVRDCRPLPPTPNSSAFPSGSRITRVMRDTCSIASRNITSFMGVLDIELKSSRYSSTTCVKHEEV